MANRDQVDEDARLARQLQEEEYQTVLQNSAPDDPNHPISAIASAFTRYRSMDNDEQAQIQRAANATEQFVGGLFEEGIRRRNEARNRNNNNRRQGSPPPSSTSSANQNNAGDSSQSRGDGEAGWHARRQAAFNGVGEPDPFRNANGFQSMEFTFGNWPFANVQFSTYHSNMDGADGSDRGSERRRQRRLRRERNGNDGGGGAFMNFLSGMFPRNNGVPAPLAFGLNNLMGSLENMGYEEWLEYIQNAGGDVHRGATEEQINACPTRKLEQDITGEGEDTTCPVCLGEFKKGETIRTLPCSHFFHKDCIDPWLNTRTTCPRCRADMRGESGGSGGNRSGSGNHSNNSSSRRSTSSGNSSPRREGSPSGSSSLLRRLHRSTRGSSGSSGSRLRRSSSTPSPRASSGQSQSGRRRDPRG